MCVIIITDVVVEEALEHGGPVLHVDAATAGVAARGLRLGAIPPRRVMWDGEAPVYP